MTRPDPQYGQVVRLEYLWASEDMAGRSQGEKHRPCALVVAMRAEPEAPLRVMVCPITHTEPRPPSEGIEIPQDEKRLLGLDSEPSWIITSEVNKVDWWDRRFVQTPSGQWTYGNLSLELMTEVKRRIQARINAGNMDIVNRQPTGEAGAAG